MPDLKGTFPMSIYRLAGPVLRLFSPERAHSLAIHALKAGLVPGAPAFASPRLAQSIWGLNFPTPIGLAAGFDKNADVPGAMLNQGFGFVEVGSITPKAQPGTPKPRLFRDQPHGL
jgi:dihydroorotate dehydrogenase